MKSYELLFTEPLTLHEKVAAMEDIKIVGNITHTDLGCALITRDGQEFEIHTQGWNGFKNEEKENK